VTQDAKGTAGETRRLATQPQPERHSDLPGACSTTLRFCLCCRSTCLSSTRGTCACGGWAITPPPRPTVEEPYATGQRALPTGFLTAACCPARLAGWFTRRGIY